MRFCPLLLELEADAEESQFDLPYRMVFAVATLDSVVLYDTGSRGPVAVLGSLHCDSAPITDMAWSCDGRFLAVSSYDGVSHGWQPLIKMGMCTSENIPGCMLSCSSHHLFLLLFGSAARLIPYGQSIILSFEEDNIKRNDVTSGVPNCICSSKPLLHAQLLACICRVLQRGRVCRWRAGQAFEHGPAAEAHWRSAQRGGKGGCGTSHTTQGANADTCNCQEAAWRGTI